jgi:hypothetical protein
MNGRMLIRGIAISVTLALTACATAPPHAKAPPQEMSILDAMGTRSNVRPASCAALDAATVCVQASRLDRTKKCGCVERQSLTDGSAFRF